MFLKKFRVRNFRNLRSLEIDLKPGITLIKARNEGGKTSLRKAFGNAFFADPKTASARARGMATWGGDSLYEFSFEFAAGGRDYRLVKDFEAKTAVLEDLGTGKKLTDKKRIAAAMAGFLGLPTPALLSSTVYFSAEELSKVKDANDLRARLEEKLAGVEGISIEELVRKIDGEISRLNKGLARPAREPGPVKSTADRLTLLRSRLAEVQAEVERSSGYYVKLNELDATIQELQKQLEEKKREYERCSLWKKAREAVEDSRKEFEKYSSLLELRNKYVKETEALEKDLERLELEEGRLAAALSLFQEVLHAAGQVDSINIQISELKNTIGKIEETQKNLEILQKERDGRVMVDPEDLTKSQWLHEEIRALELAGREQGFWIEINPLSGVVPQVVVDGVEGPWKEGAPIDARVAVRVVFPGVAELKVANKNKQAADNLERERRLAEEHRKLLDKYKVQTHDELAALKNARDEAENRVRVAEAALKAVLGDKDMQQYRSRLAALGAELAKYQDELRLKGPEAVKAAAGIEPQAAPGDNLYDFLSGPKASCTERLACLRALYREKNNLYQQYLGRLKDLPGAGELEESKKEWASRLFIAQTAFTELDLPGLTLEKIAGLEAEMEKLNGTLARLTDEKVKLEARLDTARYGIEDVENIVEEIEYCENLLKGYKNRVVVLQRVKELFEEARKNTLVKITGEIAGRMSVYAGKLTGSRYSRVEVEPGSLELKVFSEEKGNYVDIDNELSTGTRDQIYLAARLAMVPAVTNGKKPPLFLDDSLVFFDADRRRRAFEILRELAGEHQIIIFSCHDYYDELADHVISLS